MYAVMKEQVPPVQRCDSPACYFSFLDNRESAAQEGSAKSGFSLNREMLPGDDGLWGKKEKGKKGGNSTAKPCGLTELPVLPPRLNAALIPTCLLYI